jgi:hypothetical protein
MKWAITLLLTAAGLGGCVLFRWQAPRAGLEISNAIQIPEWGKELLTIEGSQAKALQIAMQDLLPVGRPIPANTDPYSRCLRQIENYDIWVKRGAGVTYIHFTPREERCGLKPEVVDAGASYVISDAGVILKQE